MTPRPSTRFSAGSSRRRSGRCPRRVVASRQAAGPARRGASPVDGARAIELTEQALDILRDGPDDDAMTTAIAARHTALLHIEHHSERLEVGRRWVQLTEARRHSVGTALTWRVYDLIEHGDPPDIEYRPPGARAPRRPSPTTCGSPSIWHFAASLEAKWLLMEGRFAEAGGRHGKGTRMGCARRAPTSPCYLAGQRFGLIATRGACTNLRATWRPFLDPENATLPAGAPRLILAHHAGGEIRAGAIRAPSHGRRTISPAVPRDMFWLGIMCLFAEAAAELGEPETSPADLRPRLEPYARLQRANRSVHRPRAGARVPCSARRASRRHAARSTTSNSP